MYSCGGDGGHRNNWTWSTSASYFCLFLTAFADFSKSFSFSSFSLPFARILFGGERAMMECIRLDIRSRERCYFNSKVSEPIPIETSLNLDNNMSFCLDIHGKPWFYDPSPQSMQWSHAETLASAALDLGSSSVLIYRKQIERDTSRNNILSRDVFLPS